MAYIHYFRHTRPISDADWTLCVAAFTRIVDDALSGGLSLCVEPGEGPLSHHDAIGRAWHITGYAHGPALQINGAGDQGAERFVFWKNATPAQPWQIQENTYTGFSAIKTENKSYDAIVVAFLCWLQARLPHCLDMLDSDGQEDGWDKGLAIARRLFPDLVLINPIPAEPVT